MKSSGSQFEPCAHVAHRCDLTLGWTSCHVSLDFETFFIISLRRGGFIANVTITTTGRRLNLIPRALRRNTTVETQPVGTWDENVPNRFLVNSMRRGAQDPTDVPYQQFDQGPSSMIGPFDVRQIITLIVAVVIAILYILSFCFQVSLYLRVDSFSSRISTNGNSRRVGLPML